MGLSEVIITLRYTTAVSMHKAIGIEQVWAYPDMSRLAQDSVLVKDEVMLEGCYWACAKSKDKVMANIEHVQLAANRIKGRQLAQWRERSEIRQRSQSSGSKKSCWKEAAVGSNCRWSAGWTRGQRSCWKDSLESWGEHSQEKPLQQQAATTFVTNL